MILKTTILLLCGLTGMTFLSAQCDNCEPAEGFEPDYCFTHEALPGYCAQFKLGDEHFYLQQKEGKAPRKLAIPADLSLDSMLVFVGNKDNKIKKPNDVLFVSKALEAWSKKKGTLVADNAAKDVFSAADLENMEFEDKYPSGLKIHVVHRGDGPLPKKGQNVVVHYRGYLESAKIFDESHKRGQPFAFPLGMGRVIKGWDEGIGKLPVGSRAILKLPASIAYGDRGAGADIPPGATLLFDVVLMDVK